MNPADALGSLVTCLEEQFDGQNFSFIGVIMGDSAQPAFDMLGEHCTGVAWVRLTTFYPSLGVGLLNEQPGSCQSSFSFDIEIGAIRCIELQEEPWDGAQTAAMTQTQIDDMFRMLRAVNCCFGDETSGYVLQPYVPYGPDGNALGGGYNLIVSMD